MRARQAACAELGAGPFTLDGGPHKFEVEGGTDEGSGVDKMIDNDEL